MQVQKAVADGPYSLADTPFGAEVSHLAPALAAIQGASSLAAFDPRILSLDPVALTAVFQQLPDSAKPTAWDLSQLDKIRSINALEDGSVRPTDSVFEGIGAGDGEEELGLVTRRY
ncbi:uncharacterized protein JCM15063_002057 [Sporobolomyces koalae]|uniref:uncharacterized protein n=1 Tax=Sporobolomyces koalae TaxID=500713 RepID=UPI00317ADF22